MEERKELFLCAECGGNLFNVSAGGRLKCLSYSGGFPDGCGWEGWIPGMEDVGIPSAEESVQKRISRRLTGSCVGCVWSGGVWGGD